MPRLDREIWPAYREDGLDVVTINTSRRTGYPAEIWRDLELTLPLGFDLDSEVVRAYRVPGWVFPLHVVVGRDGRIAHIDTEESLDDAEAAIVRALDEPAP